MTGPHVWAHMISACDPIQRTVLVPRTAEVFWDPSRSGRAEPPFFTEFAIHPIQPTEGLTRASNVATFLHTTKPKVEGKVGVEISV